VGDYFFFRLTELALIFFPDSWRGSDKCKSRLNAGVEASASVAGTDVAKVGANTNDGLTSSLGPGGLFKDKLGEARGQKEVRPDTTGDGPSGKVGVKVQASAGVKGCIGTGSR